MWCGLDPLGIRLGTRHFILWLFCASRGPSVHPPTDWVTHTLIRTMMALRRLWPRRFGGWVLCQAKASESLVLRLAGGCEVAGIVMVVVYQLPCSPSR